MDDCEHIQAILQHPPTLTPSADGCEDCLRIGSWWVHLRMCQTCGHAGCCNESPNRHASAHAAAAGHPVISSLEPGESWLWCFEHDLGIETA